MKLTFASAAIAVLVATGCSDTDGGQGLQGDPGEPGGGGQGGTTSDEGPGPIEEVDGEIHIGEGRYYNACNLMAGKGLTTANKTRFPGSLTIQETYAEAGIDPAYADPSVGLWSTCTARGLDGAEPQDLVFQVRVEHYATEKLAEQWLGGSSAEPFGSAADARVVEDSENNAVDYIGHLGRARIVVEIDPDADGRAPSMTIAQARQQLDPVVERIFAEAADSDSHAVFPTEPNKLGTTVVVDACEVFDADLAGEVFAKADDLDAPGAQEVDPSEIIRTRHPNQGAIAAGTQISSHCVRRSAKATVREAGKPEPRHAEAVVGIDIYSDAQRAKKEFEIYQRGGTPLPGLAAPAFLDDTAARPKVVLLKGPYIVEVSIVWVVDPGDRAKEREATTAEEFSPLVAGLVAQLP